MPPQDDNQNPISKPNSSEPSEYDNIEPPDNLPFVEPEENKKPTEETPKEVSTSIPPVPETLANKNSSGKGMRGPLPGKPVIPLKQSVSKFGQIQPPPKPVVAKPTSPGPTLDLDKELPEVEPNKRTMPSIELASSKLPEKKEPTPTETPKASIGVPLPPAPPAAIPEEPKTPEAAGIPKVTPPTAPPSSGGNLNGTGSSKNIRPQRFIVLIIVLLLFVVAVILGVWTIFFRPFGGNQTPIETPTPALVSDSLLLETPIPTTDFNSFSSPTPTFYVFTPTPSSNVIDTTVDSDGDQLPDYLEICWGSDSYNPDSDGDGYLDGQEVINSYDPLIPSPNDKITGTPRCGKP